MGRRPCCNKESVNRGSWSAEEDQILTNYIKTHGEGKWDGVPREAGLNRCGKSCRLRWLNYLRPDIKRGSISLDEEDLILRLHRLLGNRWALIAKRLPGRTDNEIKNYWNTNLVKKLQDKTSSYPSLKSFKSKQEKTIENHARETPNHVIIRPKAFHCRKVLISPEEGDVLMNTSSTGFVCDDQNNLSTLMQVEDDSSLNFLMDFDISQLFVPDILNSNFLQIEGINEVPAEVLGNVVGVTGTSSSSDFLFSENEVLKENGMKCDPLQTSLDMELMKVASFLDLED